METKDERLQEEQCMKFLYDNMSLSDRADYEEQLFIKFVRHALKLRKIMPWGERIDTPTFLNYVMQYRINNENIEFYSEKFFGEIYPRIQGMDMYRAAIEVNFWALEKASYHSTDDRTASPFTVLKNGYGRCGEESTLLTAALRSVGIPARQVYAPRWSHCDDNHAWVEVWIDGVWHFMGACEPEMRLDRGWFCMAASKSPIIHTRAFSNLIEEKEAPCILKQTPGMTELNVLSHYAQTKRLTVFVTDQEGRPGQGVTVRFETVNYSEFYPVVVLKTDQDGKVLLETVPGDLVVFAWDEEFYHYEKVDVRVCDEVTMTLDLPSETEVVEMELVPAEGGYLEEALTEEEQREQEKKVEAANQIRKNLISTFYLGETAEKYADSFDVSDDLKAEIAQCIAHSRGNHAEIRRFLEEGKENGYYRVKLLSSLREKDLSDISYETLQAHLTEAMEYCGKYAEDVFIKYLLCPRILDEWITAYRKPLKEVFSRQQIQEIQSTPAQAARIVVERVKEYEDSGYSDSYTTPMGAWNRKAASGDSIQILIVAVLRSLGIAAKLELSERIAVYWDGGRWIPADPEKNCIAGGSLILTAGDGTEFEYYKNMTISRLEGRHYENMDLHETAWRDGRACYHLKMGNYRIITANRGLDGRNYIKLFFARVEAGKETKMEISLSHMLRSELQVEISDKIWINSENSREVSLKNCVRPGIIAWLEVGMEPTEHLLNEIIEAKEKYKEEGVHTYLVIKEEKEQKDPTLERVRKVIPNLNIMIEREKYEIDSVYDGLKLSAKKLPLAIVVDEEGRATGGFAGYNVGIGELLLKLLKSSTEGR